MTGDIKGNVSIAAQQGVHFTQQQQQQHQNNAGNPQNPMNPQATNPQNPQSQQQMPGAASMLNPSQNQSMPQQGPMGGLGGIPGQNQMGGDTYSISQSQTINFTQQTLRQRNAGGKLKISLLNFL